MIPGIPSGRRGYTEGFPGDRAAATRIGGRYMGEGRAAEFGARNGARRTADPADPGSDNCSAGSIRLTGTLLS